MARGKDKVPMEYYSYRVEFQARGLPHIHGVAWIEQKFLREKLKIEGDFCDNLNKVRDLADRIISCQIPDHDSSLASIIKDRRKEHDQDNEPKMRPTNAKRNVSERLFELAGPGGWV